MPVAYEYEKMDPSLMKEKISTLEGALMEAQMKAAATEELLLESRRVCEELRAKVAAMSRERLHVGESSERPKPQTLSGWFGRRMWGAQNTPTQRKVEEVEKVIPDVADFGGSPKAQENVVRNPKAQEKMALDEGLQMRGEVMAGLQRCMASAGRALYGMDEVIKVLVFGVVMNQNVYLGGPPGGAKSLVVKAVHGLFPKAKIFETCMHATAPPDDLLGPPDLKLLFDGQLKRCMDGYMPTADLAFVDEGFKADKGTLSIFLPMLNERRVQVGADMVEIPLWSTFLASNESPMDPGSAALMDRLHLRVPVDLIKIMDGPVDSLLAASVGAALPAAPEHMDLGDLKKLHAGGKWWYKDQLKTRRPREMFTTAAWDLYLEMMRHSRAMDDELSEGGRGADLTEGGFKPYVMSNRRVVQTFGALLMMAFTNLRDTIQACDLYIMIFYTWNNREQYTRTRQFFSEEYRLRMHGGGGGFDAAEAAALSKNAWLTEDVRAELAQKLTDDELKARSQAQQDMDDEDALRKEEEQAEVEHKARQKQERQLAATDAKLQRLNAEVALAEAERRIQDAELAVQEEKKLAEEKELDRIHNALLQKRDERDRRQNLEKQRALECKFEQEDREELEKKRAKAQAEFNVVLKSVEECKDDEAHKALSNLVGPNVPGGMDILKERVAETDFVLRCMARFCFRTLLAIAQMSKLDDAAFIAALDRTGAWFDSSGQKPISLFYRAIGALHGKGDEGWQKMQHVVELMKASKFQKAFVHIAKKDGNWSSTTNGKSIPELDGGGGVVYLLLQYVCDDKNERIPFDKLDSKWQESLQIVADRMLDFEGLPTQTGKDWCNKAWRQLIDDKIANKAKSS